MENFDQARQRIESRQRIRNIFLIWLTSFFVSLVAVMFLIGVPINPIYQGFVVVLVALSGIVALVRGVQLYSLRPTEEKARPEIENEMVWLFGDDWPVYTGPQERLFAEARIRRRGRERWLFYLHMILAFLFGGCLLEIGLFLVKYASNNGIWIFIGVTIWAFFLLLHGRYVFPTNALLASRERAVGESLRHELTGIQPEKRKHEEKLKRDQRLIGDDGELVEDFTPSETDDEKQKRTQAD